MMRLRLVFIFCIGSQIANETAQVLSKVVQSVEKTANLVAGISTWSNERAAGITQINQGIGLVSNVVQTNSATAEESAAAGKELSSQAEALEQMVGKFALKNGVKSEEK